MELATYCTHDSIYVSIDIWAAGFCLSAAAQFRSEKASAVRIDAEVVGTLNSVMETERIKFSFMFAKATSKAKIPIKQHKRNEARRRTTLQNALKSGERCDFISCSVQLRVSEEFRTASRPARWRMRKIWKRKCTRFDEFFVDSGAGVYDATKKSELNEGWDGAR